VNAANNGFFQANGDSVAAKIIQDTGALVDEDAGAEVTLQGYLRGLGVDYQLETQAHKVLIGEKPIVNTEFALDGTSESIYTRNDRFWQITTDFISEQDFFQWREFVQSVHGGETFILDPYGSILTPDKSIAVELDDAPKYSNPYSKVMQISMRVREV